MTRAAIRAIAEDREIPYLVHFTRAANLPSILQHGLYPVDRFTQLSVNPQKNDTLRLDGHLSAISLSIAFPNCLMFYRLRQENPGTDWVVLLINPAIIWEKDCAFCRHNAADARISSQSIEGLKSAGVLASLFLDIVGNKRREGQNLKPFDTTDVQAEVLVFDVIEPSHIGGIIFNSQACLEGNRQFLQSKYSHVHLYNTGYFANRSYCRR